MSNEITPFVYGDLVVRSILKEDKPWFVVKDVCKVLGVKQSGRAIVRFPDDEVNKTHFIDTLGREQEYLLVNEPGLYRLIFRSNKPEAKTFQNWVYKEVLPSIRKTGGYGAQSSISLRGPYTYLNDTEKEFIIEELTLLDSTTKIYSFSYYMKYFLHMINAEDLNSIRSDEFIVAKKILTDMSVHAESIRLKIDIFMDTLAKFPDQYLTEDMFDLDFSDWHIHGIISKLKFRNNIKTKRIPVSQENMLGGTSYKLSNPL